MTAIIVIVILTLIAVGVSATLGLGLFSLVFLALGLGIAVWFLLAGASGMRTRDVTRRGAEHGDFFGPGGPDDPTR